MKKLPLILGIAAGVAAVGTAAVIIAVDPFATPTEKVEKSIKNAVVNIVKTDEFKMADKVFNGGSVEVLFDVEKFLDIMGGASMDIDVGAKMYFDFSKQQMAVEGNVKMEGNELADASLFFTKDAVAAFSDVLLGGDGYGVDFTDLENNLSDSWLGSQMYDYLGIDADEVNEALGLLKTNMDYSKDLQKNYIAVCEIVLDCALDAVQDNAEISTGKDSMTFGETTVSTDEITLTMDDEALVAFMEDFLTSLRESKKIEKHLDKIESTMEDMSALIGEDEEFEGLYESFIESLDDALDNIDDIEDSVEGFELEVVFDLSKGLKKELLGVELSCKMDGEKVKAEFACGPTWSKIEEARFEVDSGYSSVEAVYVVDTDDKNNYNAKLEVGADDYTVLEANISWDKKSGDFTLNADVDGEEFTVDAILLVDESSISISPQYIETPDIEQDVSFIQVIINTSEVMPEMGEFKDVLTMSEEEIAELGESVGSTVMTLIEEFIG